MVTRPTVDQLRAARWPGWQQLAACLHADPEVWFPSRSDWHIAQHAKQICQGCPVRGECLDQALAEGYQHGIWGGLTADERRGAYDHPLSGGRVA